MRVERGDTIEYLGTAHDDAGKPLRGRIGIVEEFYGRSGPSGRRYMMRVRFGSHVYDMSQEAPLHIVKHARRHHRSRYPSGQHKPRFRVGQTVKFRARTHHGEPVSYGRVQSVSGLREHGEQPLYSIKLPNGVTVLTHQESLAASPRSKASQGRDPHGRRLVRRNPRRDAESSRRSSKPPPLPSAAIRQMTGMLTKAGYPRPASSAQRLAAEGIGPAELAFRLRVDSRPPARSKTRTRRDASKRIGKTYRLRAAALKRFGFSPKARLRCIADRGDKGEFRPFYPGHAAEGSAWTFPWSQVIVIAVGKGARS